jgi:hypothetical protein
MDFTAGHRETITEVYPGDLVNVRLEHRDGKLVRDSHGRLPYLVYKPFFAGEELVSRRRAQHLHGEENTTPEWQLDIGPIWTPTPGLLAIEGGGGDARFRVFRTVEHCRADPGLQHTLSFYRVDAVIPRPRGAARVRVADPTMVQLASADQVVNVLMMPGATAYPLGFALTIQPLTVTTLFFEVVL